MAHTVKYRRIKLLITHGNIPGNRNISHCICLAKKSYNIYAIMVSKWVITVQIYYVNIYVVLQIGNFIQCVVTEKRTKIGLKIALNGYDI